MYDVVRSNPSPRPALSLLVLTLAVGGCVGAMGRSRGPYSEQVVVETGRPSCDGRVIRIAGSIYKRDEGNEIVRLLDGERVSADTRLYRYDGASYTMVRCDESKELEVVEFEYDRALPGTSPYGHRPDIRITGRPGYRLPVQSPTRASDVPRDELAAPMR